MILRKLEQQEHGKTRRLWEEVFTDDTREFLDYYYFVKARDNHIFVVEEDGDIRAMLQLNPYEIRIQKKTYPSFYIIAVATQKQYRSRGYMGALLRESMQEMYRKKVPFTFLMPAAEAIYTPYDFRFIYDQALGEKKSDRNPEDKRGKTAQTEAAKINSERTGKREGIAFSDALLWEAEQMADFFRNHFEDRWQVYAERDAEYYRTMILEQQSEHGGVRLIKDNGAIAGMFAYAREGSLEIREPLCLPAYEQFFDEAVSGLQGEDGGTVKIYACLPALSTGTRPVIMARIICLSEFLSALTVPEGRTVDCSFAVIDPLITQNSRVWKLYSGPEEEEVHVRETEDSEGVLPVAELTELLFGRTSAEEIKSREGVVLPEHLAGELGKITKLNNVFLNEIV